MSKKLSILLALFVAACNSPVRQAEPKDAVNAYAGNAFGSYWDQGVAELNSYDLEQYRYGAMYRGEAVLVFVTEDFSKSKQVKLDDPQQAGDDAVHVLKLNLTKKFITGIYPYSMMLSLFTPLRGDGRPMKLTATSQEWCGHTFTQMNKEQQKYHASLYSYFESEGDSSLDLDGDLQTEDGIWNLIRIAPDKLPEGKVQLLPGLLYQRLAHTGLQPVEAVCSRKMAGSTIYGPDSTTEEYMIQYPQQERTLRIFFNNTFPYTILGWEDSHHAIGNGAMGTTRAILRKRIKLDYWKHNKPADSVYRDSLNVQY